MNLQYIFHLFLLLCTYDVCYAPALHYLERFQYSPKTVDVALEFNQQFRKHLREEQSLYETVESYRVALAETGQRWQAWDSLQDAQRVYYNVSVRRLALGRLLDIIGQDAFFRGQMPEPVASRFLAVVRWE